MKTSLWRGLVNVRPVVNICIVSFVQERQNGVCDLGGEDWSQQKSIRAIFQEKVDSDWPIMFVCVEVLRPSQPNGVMSSAVSLPNHTFTGQA